MIISHFLMERQKSQARLDTLVIADQSRDFNTLLDSFNKLSVADLGPTELQNASMLSDLFRMINTSHIQILYDCCDSDSQFRTLVKMMQQTLEGRNAVKSRNFLLPDDTITLFEKHLPVIFKEVKMVFRIGFLKDNAILYNMSEARFSHLDEVWLGRKQNLSHQIDLHFQFMKQILLSSFPVASDEFCQIVTQLLSFIYFDAYQSQYVKVFFEEIQRRLIEEIFARLDAHSSQAYREQFNLLSYISGFSLDLFGQMIKAKYKSHNFFDLAFLVMEGDEEESLTLDIIFHIKEEHTDLQAFDYSFLV